MKYFHRLVYILMIFVFQIHAQKQFTLEDIFNSRKFSGKSLLGTHWMNDGKSYSFTEFDTVTKSMGVYVTDVKKNSKILVVNSAQLKTKESDKPFPVFNYLWSPDEKQILFISSPPERQYLSRLMPAGNYFIYNLAAKTFKQLTDVSEPQYNQKFSPDGSKLGFVRNNNIYVVDISSGKETQITSDGTEHIINGKFDWVYEEEFGISDGWRWSPDGKKIAFWRLDENRVPEYTMTEWDSTHLKLITMRYPKPGDQNSIAKIGVADISTLKTIWIDTGDDDNIYLPRMQWGGDNNTLVVEKMNREQNLLEIMYADAASGKTNVFLTEKSDTWLDEPTTPVYLKNGNFIWMSDRDGYNHLYLYKKDGTLINQITKGQWEVDNFYGVNEKDNTLYFSSSEISPIERHIYSVKLDGTKKKQLTNEAGTHSVNFSPTFDYFLEYFSNVDTPTKVRMNDGNGKLLRIMEENEMSVLKEYSLPKTTFFSFTTSDGQSLNASIIKPADFDSTKKYPVLFYTYGGPGSQVVKNSWGGQNYLWYAMLAQKGYLVFMLDNRGTGFRGSKFKKITYHNLGKWEVNDQIEGAKYLATLSYVDKNRIGIWGWSYGGYMSCMTILNGADYFKTAIAVAPVTHWKFYDTIYAERYMGTPEANPEGFKESSPLTYADKLKGNFLLIHGTSDDNVHFQNSVNLVTALQKANKQFSTMYYPDKNHGIYGGTIRLHLYTLMTNFLLEKL
ncbi:MAG: S9 family peptidase [Bacteroidetes bacterium]|nr:S9 family peptidase [Bacteroidota bacterium]